VLDWELSTLIWPTSATTACDLREGFGASGGYAGVDLKAFGIPTEAGIWRPCPAHRSHGGSVMDFYLAFSLFRLAAIVQGVYKRGLTAPPRRSRHPVRQPRQGDGRSRLVDRRKARLNVQPGSERTNGYSSVTGTIEASLPTGQPAVSITALEGRGSAHIQRLLRSADAAARAASTTPGAG
jgi:hypothetical protein